MQNTNDAFDQIMEKVGYNGRFQRIFNGVYIIALTFCCAMSTFNLILALNVPDHWCHVPGRGKTNFTIEEWRNITLPRAPDNRGQVTFSTCKMYNASFSQMQNWDYENYDFNNSEVLDCVHGYEYDKQWYDRTIITEQDWVCDKDLYVTNIFVFSRVTEVIGTFIFGQLGDTIGRKKVCLISIIIMLGGRSLSLVVTSSYWLFFITSGVAVLTSCSMSFAPLIISLEISREDQRSSIVMAQNIGWAVGTSTMPLIYWYFRDWVPYMWLTTLPTVIGLIFYKYMIESPRWLISKRRFGDALVQFQKIAKINNRKIDLCEKDLLELNEKDEKTYGIMSLFSNWRMAKTTIIMAFSWCVVAVSYFTLILFSSRMDGNPFINFLLQSLVEIPSLLAGKYLSDFLGRRLTNSCTFMVAGLACIPIILLAKDTNNAIILVIIASFIKFCNGITFFAVNLQGMETYPTCLRQTGLSLGAIVANAVGVLAPYFVYLGTNYDIRYPYIILIVLFFLGGFSALFLPETLHQKLPDTIEEAKLFGQKQKFWSLPKSPKIVEDASDEETIKINQEKYEI